MDTEILNVLLSCLDTALISAGVSLVIGILTNKYNYKKLFAETVSSNRMEWINIWRESIAEVIVAKEIMLKSNQVFDKDLLERMYKAKAMVVLRLNPNEENHRKLNYLLEIFVNITNIDDFYTTRTDIENLTRNILKPEWERVKKEAGGKNGK